LGEGGGAIKTDIFVAGHREAAAAQGVGTYAAGEVSNIQGACRIIAAGLDEAAAVVHAY
jgi:hypothetical protein